MWGEGIEPTISRQWMRVKKMKEKKMWGGGIESRPLGSEGELIKWKKRDVRHGNRAHDLSGIFREKIKRN